MTEVFGWVIEKSGTRKLKNTTIAIISDQDRFVLVRNGDPVAVSEKLGELQKCGVKLTQGCIDLDLLP